MVLFIQSTYKNRLSCGVAPFSFKSIREDSIVVVSVMACHLPVWPPVGTTGASLMTSSSTVAAWFLAIAQFGATVAGQSGSIVSTPTPKAAVIQFMQSTYKNRLSCGVAPFSFKSTREDSIVVVSVMACHLPAWPPVGTTGASLMTSSSTVAAWFLAIAHFGATVAGQSVMGLRPCSTSRCWLSIPMYGT